MTCRVHVRSRQHHQIPQYPFMYREHELVVIIVDEVLEKADSNARYLQMKQTPCRCSRPARNCTPRCQAHLVGAADDHREEIPYPCTQPLLLQTSPQLFGGGFVCADAVADDDMEKPYFWCGRPWLVNAAWGRQHIGSDLISEGVRNWWPESPPSYPRGLPIP